MATLEQEVQDLKTRLTRLEAMIHRLANATPQAGGTGARAPLDQTQLLAWLKTHGLARDPTAEECRVAAEWEALSEADKQAHLAFMHRLILDPPLSQFLIAQRH
jgi:hypothetical protein